jgi:hypothetical protein
VLKNGQPAPVAVSVGPTDGSFTTIQGGELTPGAALVVDTVSLRK